MAKPIIPLYKRWNRELGAWQWGLAPEDFHRVQAGYACERCLEPFDFWVAKCPVCKHEQEEKIVIDAPSEWRH